MGDINTYRCSCGSLIRECSFWNKVCLEAQKRHLSFTLEDFGTRFRSDTYLCDRILRAGIKGSLLEMFRAIGFRLLSRCRHKRDDIVLQNKQLIEIILELQCGSVFLDGSKDPNRVRYFYDSGYWNIKVIYLIRDGRGTTNSYMRHNHTDMQVAAREWVSVHRECDRMRDLLGRDCLTLRYEDFCRDPGTMLKRIFSFVQLDANGISTDFKSVTHHILGNAMRMNSTSEIRMDERWKTMLSDDDPYRIRRNHMLAKWDVLQLRYFQS